MTSFIKLLSASVLLLICAFNPAVCVGQNTIGNLLNTEASYNGYTFFTVNTNTYLIDNCGRVINQWTSDYPPGNAVYLLEDGSILRTTRIANDSITIGGRGGRIERKDWDDNLIWEYTYSDDMVAQHHDVYPMPNGNILILAVTRKTETEALQAGRDPANLPSAELYNEQIIEIQPSGSNGATVVWEWNLWDHLIQDFDNTRDNFGVVADNPQLLDINYLGFSGGGANWVHVNSIQYNEALDQIVLSGRQLNEIYIIDHSTTTVEAATNAGGLRGKGGDFLYRWGNPEAYDQGSPADQQFFGQHYPHWIPETYPDGGKLIIYNNGSGRTPFYSSVEIINPPVSSPGDYITPVGGSFGPAAPDYTYTDPVNQENFFSLILSSAQRLPNGNTLICEGTNGRFFEIDSNETVVWEYINPDTPAGILSQGDPPPSANNVFRVLRYSVDYPAFNGRDLSPGDPIENNPNTQGCSIFNDDIIVLIDDTEGLENTSLSFPVRLTNESDEDITLTFGFTGTTATPSDFSNTDIQLTIPSGTLAATVDVTLTDDTIYEADEAFSIFVRSVDAGTVDDSSDTAIGTILDNDEVPSLMILDAEAIEGNELNFEFTLSNPSFEDISITLEITDISTDITDYAAGDLQVTIPAENLSAQLSINTTQDSNIESDESFTVGIANLDSGNLGNLDVSGTGTILNDDFGNASLILYPVPVIDALNIQTPLTTDFIEVFDLSGSRIAHFDNENLLDLSTLASGVYILRFHSDSGDIIKRRILVQ